MLFAVKMSWNSFSLCPMSKAKLSVVDTKKYIVVWFCRYNFVCVILMIYIESVNMFLIVDLCLSTLRRPHNLLASRLPTIWSVTYFHCEMRFHLCAPFGAPILTKAPQYTRFVLHNTRVHIILFTAHKS